MQYICEMTGIKFHNFQRKLKRMELLCSLWKMNNIKERIERRNFVLKHAMQQVFVYLPHYLSYNASIKTS